MEISSSPSLMLNISTNALVKALDAAQEAVVESIEAIASGESDGSQSSDGLDIYA